MPIIALGKEDNASVRVCNHACVRVSMCALGSGELCRLIRFFANLKESLDFPGSAATTP